MKSNIITRSQFRSDINGLRAWAVVAVILYHFGVPGFKGGFIGVDVFFVISGFLMTGIIVGGLERDPSGFSLIRFYIARAYRILPALIVLCAVLLTLGWWVLLPLDYKRLGVHVIFSLAFLSNIKFSSEVGYFDVTSHEKWLLHTWSLAVEWQFYILLPLILLAIWKWRPNRRYLLMVVIVLLLASLALSIIATPLVPNQAFYLLPTRAWEMLAGGAVYFLAHRCLLSERQRAMLEAVGLVLVIISIALFDASSPWPGWRAIFPVAGTAAVLIASRSKSCWTGHPTAQYLGTRSYSLYLWHWPIVVSLTYLKWQNDPKAIVGGLMLTLVLGHLSYLLVESTSRVQLGNIRMARGATLLLSLTLVLALTSVGIRLTGGVAGRFNTALNQVADEFKNRNPRSEECNATSRTYSPSCIYGGDHLRAILIGDSHADAIVTAFAAAIPVANDGIMQWSNHGCPTIWDGNYLPTQDAPQDCRYFFNSKMKELSQILPKNIPLVVINRSSLYPLRMVYFERPDITSETALLNEYAQRLISTSCEMAKNRTVYLVRPIPEMDVDVPSAMARAIQFGDDIDISISLTDYHQRHALVWAAQNTARDRCGVKILDPLPYLCRDDRCYGTKNGRPIYYDSNHMSEYGNKLLVPMFHKVFETNHP